MHYLSSQIILMLLSLTLLMMPEVTNSGQYAYNIMISYCEVDNHHTALSATTALRSSSRLCSWPRGPILGSSLLPSSTC